MVTVTILVSSEAIASRGDAGVRAVEEELRAVSGKQPVRVDPQTDDEELRRYYTITAETEAEAEAIARRLQQLDGVEAAYVKPRGEPPM